MRFCIIGCEVWASVRGLRETAQDAEGQSLRIVPGAGGGMGWLMALGAA